MATYYSSFFNSGLRAPDSEMQGRVSRPRTPDPSTPRAFKTADDTTPTPSDFSLPASASSNNVLPSLLSQVTDPIPTSANADRPPRMRRRRSSLSLSASPVTALKSAAPIPRASVHLQRNSMGVLTVGRVRSGSITEIMSRAAMNIGANEATQANSLMGRLRSGSVGTSLRSTSRRLRKQASVPCPAPPPPTSPLPEVPQLKISTNTTGMFPPPSTPRRSISGRMHTTDSIPMVINTPGRDDSMLSSPSGARGAMHGDDSDAMDMDDYPTPLETPGEVKGDSYFG